MNRKRFMEKYVKKDTSPDKLEVKLCDGSSASLRASVTFTSDDKGVQVTGIVFSKGWFEVPIFQITDSKFQILFLNLRSVICNLKYRCFRHFSSLIIRVFRGYSFVFTHSLAHTHLFIFICMLYQRNKN